MEHRKPSVVEEASKAIPAILKNQREQNRQARELGMSIPFPQAVPKEKQSNGSSGRSRQRQGSRRN